LFAGDEKATGLTGSVSYSNEKIAITINGVYDAGGDAVTINNLSFNADLENEATSAKLNINGSLENNLASLSINEGSVSINGTEANRLFRSENEEEQDQFINGLNSISLALDATIKAKDLEGAEAVFNGALSLDIIRSSNNYIAYDTTFIDGRSFRADPEPYYNIKSVILSGSFTHKEESFSANIELTNQSAEDFTPITSSYIGYIPELDGSDNENDFIYDTLLSYRYSGDSLEFKTPTTHTTITGQSSSKAIIFENSYSSTNTTNLTLENFIKVEANCYNYETGENYSFLQTDLEKGEHEVILTNDSEEILSVSYVYSDTSFEYSCSYDRITRYTLEDTIEVYGTTDNIYRIEKFRADFHDKTIKDTLSGYISLYNNGDYQRYYIDIDSLIIGEDQQVTGTSAYPNPNYDSTPTDKIFTYNLSHTKFELYNGEELLKEKEVIIINRDILTLNLVTETQSKDGTFDTLTDSIVEYSLSDFSSYPSFLSKNYNRVQHLQDIGTFLTSYPQTFIQSNEFTPINAEFIFQDYRYFHEIYYRFYYDSYHLPFYAHHIAEVIHGENKDNFNTLDVNIELTAVLAGTGSTDLSASIERTAYNSGIATLNIENIDAAETSANVSIVAAVEYGEISDFVISNDRGFFISNSALDDSDADAITITYGKATAVIEKTDSGLKVSYTDPETGDTAFDLYL